MERKNRRTERNYARFKALGSSSGTRLSFWRWLTQTITSGIIAGLLAFILISFYVFSSIVSIDSFLFVFLILTGITDGLFLLLHLFRRPGPRPKVSCDPAKLSAVICTYNGADVLGETIQHLLRQLPADHIIVVNDASTDHTPEVAESYGVKVVTNRKNLNKGFGVSIGVHAVQTPYVLLLDDDVLIGKAVIPTNLLDEGYSAVAFSVMPTKTDTLVNAIQQFEYRNSMHLGKNVRAPANAIGNISGAIGLYRTSDLQEQAYLHTGQFSGEDEQRTLLTHLYGQGKGIAYSGDTVYTHAPNTFHTLYRQRSYGWGIAVPEMLILYLRILFSPRFHLLLKAEKAYYLYIYLTDPLRLLFLWTLFLRPRYLLVTYAAYFIMNTLVWLKTGRKDQFLVVLIYPLYTLWLTLCRFIGNFYWFIAKLKYFAKRHHKRVERRPVIAEFIVIALIFIAAWAVSGLHFAQDMSLFNKIRTSRLEETTQTFSYDSESEQPASSVDGLAIPMTGAMPPDKSYVLVRYEQGDTLRAVAYKAVDRYLADNAAVQLPYAQRQIADQCVTDALKKSGAYYDASISSLLISNDVLDKACAGPLKVLP